MIKERMNLMELVSSLEQQLLVLPLFQRPFVWSEEQICDLFDSLWQAYPIGDILLLEQPPQDLKGRLQCCRFASQIGSQYSEQSLQQRRSEARIFEELPAASHLVLDGQQRLFAFFIGIAGTYLRAEGPGNFEPAQLYFDFFPLLELFLDNNGDLEALRSEHHQFNFYSDAQLTGHRNEIREYALHSKRSDLQNCDLSYLQLPLSLVRSWGRDRRTAKSEIRRFLKPMTALPKALVDEFEDMLDNLHHYLWIAESIHSKIVNPRNSYDLLEIFSRLNQGSSFKANDLHYALRIVFPQVSIHKFCRFLQRNNPRAAHEPDETSAGHKLAARTDSDSGIDSKDKNRSKEISLATQTYSTEELAELSAQEWSPSIFHELNPVSNRAAASPLGGILSKQQTFDSQELEESYERLLQTADELKLSLDFLYHCYLFCQAEEPEEIAHNIRKREGALALRNNGEHLLRFVESLDTLRDAIDSCNFIVRHWFADNLHNNYVLLPVLYYFYKQGAEFFDPLNDLSDVNLSRIVRWIALNEVAPSVFRGGMQQLARLWPVLHHSMSNAMQNPDHPQPAESEPGQLNFPLQRLRQDLQLAFSGSKNSNRERSLTLSDQDIVQLLDNTKIRHRASIPLVALLYSHPQRISLMQRYEERQIDFIQPQKLLSRRALKSYGLSQAEIELFYNRRDSVLNLQWLPKRLQTEKGEIPFRQWLGNSQQLQLLGEQNDFQKKELIINFMRFHHIKTEDGIYTINAFGRFLGERRNLLYRALKQYGQNFDDWDLQAKRTKINFAAF